MSIVCSCPTAAATSDVCPVQVVNDRAIHIHSPQDVEATRGDLFEYIWGTATLPGDHAGLSIVPGVAGPFACQGANLARVDQINVAMGPAQNGTVIHGWAWHYIPVNRKNRLVIVHDGHMDCTDFTSLETGPDAFGLQATVNALVSEGYDVLFVLMPLFVPDQCIGDHSVLFRADYAPPAGSSMRYFLDTTLQSINYLSSQQTFAGIDAIGLSGGGWTTTLYAAIDARVERSFPVAASIPLYLRGLVVLPPQRDAADNGVDSIPGAECNDVGDVEQNFPPLYEIAGYPDLYVLGAYGAGRRQVQILNRHDSCCFGEDQEADSSSYDSDLREYELSVRNALQSLGKGNFRLEVDEAAVVHQISRNAIYNIIMAELDGSRPRHRRDVERECVSAWNEWTAVRVSSFRLARSRRAYRRRAERRRQRSVPAAVGHSQHAESAGVDPFRQQPMAHRSVANIERGWNDTVARRKNRRRSRHRCVGRYATRYIRARHRLRVLSLARQEKWHDTRHARRRRQ